MNFYEEAIARKYMALIEALKCLPGVMPNKSKELIDNALEMNFIPGSLEIADFCYRVGETELLQEEFTAKNIQIQMAEVDINKETIVLLLNEEREKLGTNGVIEKIAIYLLERIQ